MLDQLAAKPDFEFRSGLAWHAYAAMCGEVEFAHRDDRLDEGMVGLFKDKVVRVIQVFKEPANRIR